MRDAFGVISKIAVRPMHHGTGEAGLKAIKRGKFISLGNKRHGRPSGISLTPSKRVAQDYASLGKKPSEYARSFPMTRKGKVVTYNMVGATPTFVAEHGGAKEYVFPFTRSMRRPDRVTNFDYLKERGRNASRQP